MDHGLPCTSKILLYIPLRAFEARGSRAVDHEHVLSSSCRVWMNSEFLSFDAHHPSRPQQWADIPTPALPHRAAKGTTTATATAAEGTRAHPSLTSPRGATTMLMIVGAGEGAEVGAETGMGRRGRDASGGIVTVAAAAGIERRRSACYAP